MTKVMAVIAMMAVVFAGVAVMASDSTDAADSKITYISGEINADTEFGTGTIVVVNGNLSIVNGATLSILDGAKFTVNEGVTLTVNGLGVNADKKPVADDKATFSVADGADVTVNGDVVVGENGDLEVAGELKANGNINFQSGSVSLQNSANGEIILGANAAMTVTSTGTKIGQIGAVTVSIMPGATLNMRGMAVGQVTVNAVPADYATEKYDAANTYGATAIIAANTYDADAKITSAKVSNIVFTASATSATAYLNDAKVTVDTAVLDVSGTVQNGDDITTTNAAVDKVYTDRDGEPVELSSAVQVSQSLTVGKTATFTINSVMNISGTANVITNDGEDPAKSLFIQSAAEITVTGTVNFGYEAFEPAAANGSLKVVGGTVTIVGCDDPTDLQIGELYGAYYTAVEGINYTTYIMDLEKAIAAAAADDSVTAVYVYSAADANEANEYEGAYTVSESFTVPSGITLYVNNVLIVPETVEVTVPVDAAVEAVGIIVVKGTVIDSSLTLDIVENGSGVVCEVTTTADEGATVTYTSLRLAIAGATEGSTITLAGDATIESALTIPTGITVVVGDYEMKVTKGAVLTVDGVLNDANDNLVTTVDDKTGKSNGSVVVNNYIITSDAAAYDEETFNVSGVYAAVDIEGIDADNIIASVPVFAGYSADATEASVQGTVSYTEAFTLTAGETGEYVLNIAGTATFGTVTLVGYEVEVGTAGLLSAVVTANGNSVELENIRAFEGYVTVANVIDEVEETNVLTVSGTPDEYSNETSAGKNIAELSATAGTVSVDGFDATKLVSFGVTEGTTVDVTGTLNVSEFAIAGTVNVDRNGNVAATGDVIVTGTLNVVNADTENVDFGQLSAANIYIGTDKKFEAQNAATVTGDSITAGTIYVSAGATFDSKVAQQKESVGLYVEDALWMTVYGNAKTTTVAIEAPVEDAVFNGWYDTEDSKKEIIPGNVITIGDYDSVTADIEYDIYNVMVVADNGVGTVAIDGVVLMKSSNVFVAEGLAAGSHTISIDVKNGYSADNVEIQVNGQTITGNTFTLSGTPEAGDDYVVVNITVSGTAVADTVVDDDSGMGVTDYLLIILVVLVIVLAIVVVMRMMRS